METKNLYFINSSTYIYELFRDGRKTNSEGRRSKDSEKVDSKDNSGLITAKILKFMRKLHHVSTSDKMKTNRNECKMEMKRFLTNLSQCRLPGDSLKNGADAVSSQRDSAILSCQPANEHTVKLII